MEFFATVDISAQPEQLQALAVSQLPQYCSEINQVLQVYDENAADVYCLWGQFKVERQLINGGVRFSLPTCPNALAWTITTGLPPQPQQVVIHCTINRAEHDEDFVESITDFVEAWQRGLQAYLS